MGQKKTLEELQLEIAQVELQTKTHQLKKAKADNDDLEAKEIRRHEANRLRMSELAQGQRNHAATVKACRHKSGGTPKNILKGGGIGSFSIISRTVLPDGVSVLLQCPRCRMIMYPPTPPAKELEAKNAKLFAAAEKQYAIDKVVYAKLIEESEDQGLEHAMRGPTFLFKNAEGVPIIPERV